MEVAHIDAEHLVVSRSIVHIELMGTNHEGLTSNSKEFGLQRITHELAWIFGLKNFVKTFLEDGSVAEFINS